MGEQPWAGVRANEVSTKVSRGQRTQLSLDLVNLDGCEELDEMVQLLWAQDPTVRPPLRDVARRLRGILPPLPLPLPPPREVEHDDVSVGGGSIPPPDFYLPMKGYRPLISGRFDDGTGRWRTGDASDGDAFHDRGKLLRRQRRVGRGLFLCP